MPVFIIDSAALHKAFTQEILFWVLDLPLEVVYPIDKLEVRRHK